MKRRPILIAIALLLALVGTGAVYVYVHSADSRAANGLKAVNVLVVTKEIPAGTPWSQISGYVTSESTPESSAPTSSLASTSADVPADQAATFPIPTGRIVVREMFAAKPATTGALAIPGKLQALSVALPANADVAGFVQSGSQVAVYSIHQLEGKGGGAQLIGTNPFASRMLLPRVNVLAVSQSAPSSVNGAGTSASGSLMVTLALTQQQAERIILAQKVGELYLALLTDSSSSAEDNGTMGIGIFNSTPLFTR